MNESNFHRSLRIANHAHTRLAEDSLDCVADRLDSAVLETVWSAEFPFLLRLGQHLYWDRTLVGEFAAIFLAGLRAASVPKSLHHRPGRRSDHRATSDRRHGIYVRSRRAVGGSFS